MANLYDQAQRQKWDQTISQVQKMGYQQNPAQPPAVAPAPPRQAQSPAESTPAATSNPEVTQLPPSATQGSAPGPSQLYMQDRADELRTQVGAGNYAQAAGTAVRTAVQGLGMYGIELADKLATPAINAAASFGRGVMGADSQAAPTTMPATTLASAVPGAPPQAAPTAPSITPQTDVQRGGGNVPAVAPPSTNPAAPSPAATGAEIAPGVYRHGRGQYSDNASGMGMPAGFTGQPNAQNMAAGESLAARSQQESMAQQSTGLQPQGVTAPTVRHSGNDWAARNALRNAEVSASSIMNTSQWGGRGAENNPSALAYQAMLKKDLALQGAQPGVDVAAMRENAGITREGMQQAGATTRTGMQQQGSAARDAERNAISRDELGLRRTAAGFQNRAAQRMEDLSGVLLDPNATPEQRSVAQRNLAALSGKTAADRMQTVTLPDTTNEMGQVVRGGQALVRTLEDGSVQQVPIGAQQGAAMPPGMKRQIGTSNGRPVYEDMNGKQVIAKG